MPKFKTAFQKSERHTFETSGPSLTRQSEMAQCDINTIMARFERTGVLDHASKYEGRYGDFTDTPDYLDAMNIVVEAEQMFGDLPAKTRKRFGNDPAEFLQFVGDPKNLDQMVEMGLAKAPLTEPVIEPTPAPKPSPEAPQKASKSDPD